MFVLELLSCQLVICMVFDVSPSVVSQLVMLVSYIFIIILLQRSKYFLIYCYSIYELEKFTLCNNIVAT
jgi:hypothetical protein